MSKILVVDDEKSIRSTFEIFLCKEGHVVFLAEDAYTAIDIFKKHEPDLVITDIIMPKSTGLDLLDSIKNINPDVPVIIMTGEPTVETAKDAVKSSALDYIIKPVNKESLLRATENALNKKKLIDERKILEKENTRYRENLEKLVYERTEELQKAIHGTIDTIIKILELKDPYTAGHERRVGELALAIARKMELSEEHQKRVFFAGILHDTGKLMVASEILAKPGKLSDGEFAVIKEHVKSGYELIKDIKLPWDISEIILQHHERLNGSGYPNGLKEEDILLEAKILAVADVLEAMSSHRPYRPKLEIKIALDEISSNSGILYDKEVADATIKLFDEDNFIISEISEAFNF